MSTLSRKITQNLLLIVGEMPQYLENYLFEPLKLQNIVSRLQSVKFS